jgi:hypothetical protein
VTKSPSAQDPACGDEIEAISVATRLWEDARSRVSRSIAAGGMESLTDKQVARLRRLQRTCQVNRDGPQPHRFCRTRRDKPGLRTR